MNLWNDNMYQFAQICRNCQAERTSSADEAPAYVNRWGEVSVPPWTGVVATYDDVWCYQETSSSHTPVPCVIRYRTPDAAHHATCSGTQNMHLLLLSNSIMYFSMFWCDVPFTFAGFVKVSVETARGAAVLRAAEASRVGRGARVPAGAGVVVEASTAIHRAAFQLAFRLVAGETDVGPYTVMKTNRLSLSLYYILSLYMTNVISITMIIVWILQIW